MQAGKLNRRVNVLKPNHTVDQYGQQTTGYETFATVWANIKPIGGKEKLRAMAYDTVLTHELTIRYDKRFLPTIAADAWHIEYGQRTFEVISAIDWMDARQWLVLEVREVGN